MDLFDFLSYRDLFDRTFKAWITRTKQSFILSSSGSCDCMLLNFHWFSCCKSIIKSSILVRRKILALIRYECWTFFLFEECCISKQSLKYFFHENESVLAFSKDTVPNTIFFVSFCQKFTKMVAKKQSTMYF